jgi:hypothetical protein
METLQERSSASDSDGIFWGSTVLPLTYVEVRPLPWEGRGCETSSDHEQRRPSFTSALVKL